MGLPLTGVVALVSFGVAMVVTPDNPVRSATPRFTKERTAAVESAPIRYDHALLTAVSASDPWRLATDAGDNPQDCLQGAAGAWSNGGTVTEV
jgi:hypothetical protein